MCRKPRTGAHPAGQCFPRPVQRSRLPVRHRRLDAVPQFSVSARFYTEKHLGNLEQGRAGFDIAHESKLVGRSYSRYDGSRTSMPVRIFTGHIHREPLRAVFNRPHPISPPAKFRHQPFNQRRLTAVASSNDGNYRNHVKLCLLLQMYEATGTLGP